MSYTRTAIPQADNPAYTSPQQPAFHECVYMDLSPARHTTTLVHPSFKLARNRTPPVSPVPSRAMSYRSPSPHSSTRLPDEILAQIAQYVLGNPFDGLDVARPASEYRKPPFRIIDGLTRASRRLRAISLPEWFRLFIVSRADDWVWASRLNGMHNWVRHIICPARALDLPTPTDVLSRFPYLRSASVALSRDYYFNPILPPSHGGIYPSAPATTEVIAGFEYRQPVSSFPSTMTSLSVRGSHGSETPLLRELAMQCPDLRSLRLSKCTMFDSCTKASRVKSNSRNHQYGQIADGSECAFWGTFPFDHDIYFGSEGVEAYAGELAAELSPLQKLEEVSVGVYLTPHAALAEHRLAHYPLRHLRDSDPLLQNTLTAASPNLSPPPILLPLPSAAEQPPVPAAVSTSIPLPAPPVTTSTPWSTSQVSPPPYLDSSLWSYDCHACRKAYAATTTATERTAGLALAATLPRLKKIEWASFFESSTDSSGTAGFRRGTGTHEWRVLRDSCGTVVDVERVF